jgi:hypothetical protein
MRPPVSRTMRQSRFLMFLLLAGASASAQSTGHVDLDVKKSSFLKLGKSHVDAVSAWVTHTDEFLGGRTMALKIQMFSAPIDAAGKARLMKSDEDNRDLSRPGSATFVLFLDDQNRIRQANLTYIIPGTTAVRSVATTTDEIAKWFGDYHFAGGRLRLKSKGAYATGADSPDEILTLAWDVSLDTPVVEHRR